MESDITFNGHKLSAPTVITVSEPDREAINIPVNVLEGLDMDLHDEVPREVEITFWTVLGTLAFLAGLLWVILIVAYFAAVNFLYWLAVLIIETQSI